MSDKPKVAPPQFTETVNRLLEIHDELFPNSVRFTADDIKFVREMSKKVSIQVTQDDGAGRNAGGIRGDAGTLDKHPAQTSSKERKGTPFEELAGCCGHGPGSNVHEPFCENAPPLAKQAVVAATEKLMSEAKERIVERLSESTQTDSDQIRLFWDTKIPPIVDRVQAEYIWRVLGGFLGKPAPAVSVKEKRYEELLGAVVALYNAGSDAHPVIAEIRAELPLEVLKGAATTRPDYKAAFERMVYERNADKHYQENQRLRRALEGIAKCNYGWAPRALNALRDTRETCPHSPPGMDPPADPAKCADCAATASDVGEEK